MANIHLFRRIKNSFQAKCTAREILGGLQFIILPFIRVGNADKELILCPIELRPQCGRNLGPISRPNYKDKEKNRMNRHP